MGTKVARKVQVKVSVLRWLRIVSWRSARWLNRKAGAMDPRVLLPVLVLLALAIGGYCLWLVLSVFR